MTVPTLHDIYQMQIEGIVFKTAKGLRPLKIAEVNFEKRTFKFLRSTGEISWSLSYDKFAEVFEKVIAGKIPLDYTEIDQHIPTFGNYAVGFMNYFIEKL
jgi:hypothetical protein